MLYIYGQEYIPFPDTNSIWSVSTEKYVISGDTVINDNVYKKYFMTRGDTTFTFERASYFAAVREDSSKRIWAIKHDLSIESLQYDFSLNIGDTVTVTPIGDFDFREGSFNVEILDIDSIQIYQTYRKRYYISDWEIWIEGIGSSMGLFHSGISTIGIVDIGYPELLCYEQDGNIQYFTWDSICYKRIWVGLPYKESSDNGYTLYPNPSSGKLIFHIDEFNMSNCYMEIFSNTGILMKSFEITCSDLEIDCTDLASGIYIYHIKDEQWIFDTGKLLIKH